MLRSFCSLLLLSLLLGSCTNQTRDSNVEKMDRTVGAYSKALRDPGLYEMLKSIEDMEYTPVNTLEFLHSAYGASFWPPPGANLHPSEAANLGEEHTVDLYPVVRLEPTAPWQLVVVPMEDKFLLQAYGDSVEEPIREETIEFPTP